MGYMAQEGAEIEWRSVLTERMISSSLQKKCWASKMVRPGLGRLSLKVAQIIS